MHDEAFQLRVLHALATTMALSAEPWKLRAAPICRIVDSMCSPSAVFWISMGRLYVFVHHGTYMAIGGARLMPGRGERLWRGVARVQN